jgi:predicted CoA-binding protein
MTETVAILGASMNPGRYSYKAQQALLENGHIPVPINPRYHHVDDIQCFPDIKSIKINIDTVTVYVRPDILKPMIDDIIHAKPGRVIFNPGSESVEASTRFESAGITVQNACTLVLLNTSSFSHID